MSIRVVKHINKEENNRIEFLFVNFDFYDGNDLIAKILCEKYKLIIEEKIDGMFYSIISLSEKDKKYKLVWHEDIGNYFYSECQNKKTLNQMQEMVGELVRELNSEFEKNLSYKFKYT